MADLHLRYSQPADSAQPLRLRFGDEGGGIAPPAIDVALHGRITHGLDGHAGAATVAQAGAHGRITRGLQGHVGAAWASNVDRPERVRSASICQSATPAAAPRAMGWHIARARQAGHGAHWQHARAGASGHSSAWRQSARRASTNAHHWQRALARALLDAARYQQARRHAAPAAARWQHAIGHGRLAGVHWQQTYSRASLAADQWQNARTGAAPLRHRFAQRAALRALLGVAHYQDARRPGDALTIVGPPGQPPCYDPAQPLQLRFVELAAPGGPLQLRFVCERTGGGPGPQPGATVVVPIRRVYIVTNDIQLIRIDGSVPLPAYAFALSLDADSWTWQWSATLPASVLPNIEPATAGTPVEVQASINGVPYRLLIERVQRSRQFAQDRLAVSGRGTAAILDAPYAPVMGFDNASAARSAQQLMGDVLTINGVPIGWAVDFGLTDWAVPAGAWSHQGSYISALNAIAQAAGGYVQPHATAQTLRILHRYPLAPWDWSALTPDVELPLAVTSVEGVEWVKKPAYNRVYVSGADGSGILGQVSIAGTPGDESAPMVTDALITHADAARQRGRAILSDTGPQALVSLTLPVLPETGLILPGQFVRRTDGAASVQGYVRAISLQWSRPRMRQTIEVQTHA